MLAWNKTWRASRGGITLLEVLVSIGVLAIGMLGAATMLPLAKYYSTEASKFDRSSTLGQEAYHDMQIRGYLSIKKWLKPQIGGFTYSNKSAILLDPLAWSYAAATGAPIPQYFPAFPNNGVSPPVASAPMVFRTNIDIANQWNDAAPFPPPVPTYLAMPYQMADRIFRSGDDLIFDRPGRDDQRPTTSGLLSPAYVGDFSWFVTLTHPPSDINNTLNMERYIASVVVFHKREINFNPADWPGLPSQKQPPPERMVFADFLQQPAFTNQAYPLMPTAVPVYAGGGSLLLRTMSNPLPGDVNWLDGLKPNQWIMLSANFIDAATASGYPRLGWYRIVSIDDQVQVSGGIASRIVTVAGSDWPKTSALGGGPIWIDADGAAGAPVGRDTAFCTIADGAIAVYEDTIPLDKSLMRD